MRSFCVYGVTAYCSVIIVRVATIRCIHFLSYPFQWHAIPDIDIRITLEVPLIICTFNLKFSIACIPLISCFRLPLRKITNSDDQLLFATASFYYSGINAHTFGKLAPYIGFVFVHQRRAFKATSNCTSQHTHTRAHPKKTKVCRN